MPQSAQYEYAPLSPTTRWSLIVAAATPGGDGTKAHEALEQLCRIYWRPILHYIIRRGYRLEDAQDLTQDFFTRLSSPAFLQSADPQKGRFRSLVFASLKHLLSDARDRAHAEKRGRDQTFVPWEPSLEERLSVADLAQCNESRADHLFDRDWAATVVRNALSRLEDEFNKRGKKREFAVIRPFLTGGGRDAACGEAASGLELPAGTLRAMVHRTRALYGNLLREEVAQTLSDLCDLDDEVRHLREILTALPDLARGSPRDSPV